MKEIITIERVEEGKSGTSVGKDGKNFDYTPYNVFSTDGRRFSTFKIETARKYRELIGKQGEIIYNVVMSKDGTKEYLNIADSQKAKQEAGLMEKLEQILQNQAEMKRLITAQAVKPQDTPPEAPESPTAGDSPFTGGNTHSDPTPPDNDPSFD